MKLETTSNGVGVGGGGGKGFEFAWVAVEEEEDCCKYINTNGSGNNSIIFYDDDDNEVDVDMEVSSLSQAQAQTQTEAAVGGPGVALFKKRKYVKALDRLEFAGWGSKPLRGFLAHIGQEDTATPISQINAASLVNKYVVDHNLLHPTKKRSIVCDPWLLSLFGKKCISRNRIYELLGFHFADNVLDHDLSVSGGQVDRASYCLPISKQAASSKKSKVMAQEAAANPNKSRFAAIVPDNIKLVYLKKDFVLKLLANEQPDSFQQKLTGAFVRIKTDPHDYSQKNSHMLVQVLGINRNARDDDKDSGILLQISNCMKDVLVSKLSDDNFSMEEVEDLRQRVQDGLVKRPTVVELEEKVRILHEDMTKHWLVGELALLQRQIDRANEKGWRQELSEYIERRQLLQTVEEQSRLLRQFPKVMAEEMGVQTEIAGENGALKSVANENEVHNGRSSTSHDVLGSRTQKVDDEDTAVWKVTDELVDVESTQFGSPNEEPENDGPLEAATIGALKALDCDSSSNTLCVATNISGAYGDLEQWRKKEAVVTPTESCGESQPSILKEEKACRGTVVKPLLEVIELSDDEEEKGEHAASDGFDHESLIWHYADPRGDVQGPFPLSSLKRWNDHKYFPHGFKVWKMGQSQKEALLLSEVISIHSLNNKTLL